MSANNPTLSFPSSLDPSVPPSEQSPSEILTPTHTSEPEHGHHQSDQPLHPAQSSSQNQRLAPEEQDQQQQQPQLREAKLELGSKYHGIQKGKVEQGTTMPPPHKRSRGPEPEEADMPQDSRNNEHGYNSETRQAKTRRLAFNEPDTEGRSLVSGLDSQNESDSLQPPAHAQSSLSYIAFPITETATKSEHSGVAVAAGPRRTSRNTAISPKHTSVLSNARGVFLGRKGNASALSRYSSGLVDHPPYVNMIEDSIRHSKDKKGATRSSIKLFIREKYCPKWDSFEDRFNDAVKRGVKDGVFKYTNNNNTRLAVVRSLATKVAKNSKALKSVQQPNQQADATRNPPSSHPPETITSAGGNRNLRSRSRQSRADSFGDSSVNTAGKTGEIARRQLRSRSDETTLRGVLPHKKR